ncbi:MAG: hypothetical protein H7X93_14450 [Sphingomonadaceae bacterium]|nr:hypothetical protein [Sphingomonadaceae bacterium]
MVLDANLQRVGYGVGRIEQGFPKGLYKLRATRGQAMQEQLLQLDRDQHIHMPLQPLTAIAPVGPVYGQWTSEIEALAEGARDAKGSKGLAAILFLAHRDREHAPDPIEGVRLQRWGNIAEEGARRSAGRGKKIGEEFWSAWATGLGPGGHQIDLGNGNLRQTLPVVAGFETRLFIRQALRGPAESTAAPLIELSLQMERPGMPVVYFDHFETIETARRAMEAERPIIVGESLVDELLHGKWQNPIMGITGAHLFLAALERERAASDGPSSRPVDLADRVRERAGSTLRMIIENLESIFGREASSDVLGLRLRARRFTSEHIAGTTIEQPPIFWSSWSALLAESGPNGSVTIPRSLWSRVANCFPSGPYFAWRKGRTSVDKQIDALLQARWQLAPAGAATPSIFKSFDAPPSPIDALDADPDAASRIADDIANALGAPRSLVEGWASRLTGGAKREGG